MKRLVIAAQVFLRARADPAEVLLVHLFHDLPDALALLVEVPDEITRDLFCFVQECILFGHCHHLFFYYLYFTKNKTG